jgi:hypothetical protein
VNESNEDRIQRIIDRLDNLEDAANRPLGIRRSRRRRLHSSSYATHVIARETLACVRRIEEYLAAKIPSGESEPDERPYEFRNDPTFNPVYSRNERGFEVVEWLDYYNRPCSLQQSSIALFGKPVSGAIWFGIEPDRMHLDTNRVIWLVSELTHWLIHGGFGSALPQSANERKPQPTNDPREERQQQK